MYTLPVLFASFLVSMLTIWAMRPIAVRIGLVDRPGGHKAHDAHVPLVGGIAIFFSLSLAWFIAPRLGLSTINTLFAAAGGLLFVIGLIDDRRPLSVRLRFGAQVVAACMLVYTNTVVRDVGTLFGTEPLGLGFLAIPVTLFAVVGAINALNMIDGMDGLAGSVSVVSFTLLGVVALMGGQLLPVLIILCVLGGLLGFLVFNMPIPHRTRAHIFMGDAGSTLLGFLLAYLLIALSQGAARSMAPVTALWIFAVPLLDTLGVMLRRMWLGSSPFAADRTHIHHLLLDAGFRVRHVVLLIAALQGLLGSLGLALHYTGLPQLLSLALFAVVFAAYAYLISRPWRFVPAFRALHGKTGWIAQGVRHVYVGNLDPETALADLRVLLTPGLDRHAVEIYEVGYGEHPHAYALVDALNADDVEAVQSQLRWNAIANGLTREQRPVIRQFFPRKAENDRRFSSEGAEREGREQARRRRDRRFEGEPRLLHRLRGHEVEPVAEIGTLPSAVVPR